MSISPARTRNGKAAGYPSRLVEEHLAVSRRAMKKVLKSRKSAREYLQAAGILDSKGNLAKAYRR